MCSSNDNARRRVDGSSEDKREKGEKIKMKIQFKPDLFPNRIYSVHSSPSSALLYSLSSMHTMASIDGV